MSEKPRETAEEIVKSSYEGYWFALVVAGLITEVDYKEIMEALENGQVEIEIEDDFESKYDTGEENFTEAYEMNVFKLEEYKLISEEARNWLWQSYDLFIEENQEFEVEGQNADCYEVYEAYFIVLYKIGLLTRAKYDEFMRRYKEKTGGYRERDYNKIKKVYLENLLLLEAFGLCTENACEEQLDAFTVFLENNEPKDSQAALREIYEAYFSAFVKFHFISEEIYEKILCSYDAIKFEEEILFKHDPITCDQKYAYTGARDSLTESGLLGDPMKRPDDVDAEQEDRAFNRDYKAYFTAIYDVGLLPQVLYSEILDGELGVNRPSADVDLSSYYTYETSLSALRYAGLITNTAYKQRRKEYKLKLKNSSVNDQPAQGNYSNSKITGDPKALLKAGLISKKEYRAMLKQ